MASEVVLEGTERRPLLLGDIIQVGYLIAEVLIPERSPRDAVAYAKHLEEYRKECVAAMPRIARLVLPDKTRVTIAESEQLKLVKCIGQGVSAAVHQAVSIAGEYFAVKIVNRSANQNRDKIAREIKALSSANHVRICFSGHQDGNALLIDIEKTNIIRISEDKVVDNPQVVCGHGVSRTRRSRDVR